MLFSTVEFLFAFLPAAFAVYLLAERALSLRAGIGALVLASFFFYGYWNVSLLPLLLVSIGVNFACGRALVRTRSRAMLIAGLVFNLGLLCYFKYAGFLLANAEAVFGQTFAEVHIVLPLAISFFTFQQVAYLVDVYQGKAAEPGLLNYCLFVSFFPQLIAGPIVHHSEMMPQFREAARKPLSRATAGVALAFLAIGLYKKVVLANGIAPVADQVFHHAATGVPATGDAWIGAFAYTFQIYFDFSGYSDMAVGLALLFGIRLPLNFNSPYKATSIIDFWRRWHITLSRFIRDYIYFPLGGNRKGKSRRYANLMLAMLIGGLWHGAGWTFVLWGGLHGLYLAINHAWRRFVPGPSAAGPLAAIAGRTLTLLAVVVAWVFFRADDIGGAGRMLQGMFGLAAGESSLAGHREVATLALMLALVWFAPNTWQLFADANPVVLPAVVEKTDGERYLPFAQSGFRQAAILPAAAILGVVSILVIVVQGNQIQRFIYMVF